jgi:hypothetical protein
MAQRESRRAAELEKLSAELVKQLEQLDFRSDSLGPALAEMARQVERTIRQSPVT